MPKFKKRRLCETMFVVTRKRTTVCTRDMIALHLPHHGACPHAEQRLSHDNFGIKKRESNDKPLSLHNAEKLRV